MNNTTLFRHTPIDGEPESLLRRAFRRLRRQPSTSLDIERTAARNRIERLFEVNFRHSWTR